MPYHKGHETYIDASMSHFFQLDENDSLVTFIVHVQEVKKVFVGKRISDAFQDLKKYFDDPLSIPGIIDRNGLPVPKKEELQGLIVTCAKRYFIEHAERLKIDFNTYCLPDGSLLWGNFEVITERKNMLLVLLDNVIKQYFLPPMLGSSSQASLAATIPSYEQVKKTKCALSFLVFNDAIFSIARDLLSTLLKHNQWFYSFDQIIEVFDLIKELSEVNQTVLAKFVSVRSDNLLRALSNPIAIRQLRYIKHQPTEWHWLLAQLSKPCPEPYCSNKWYRANIAILECLSEHSLNVIQIRDLENMVPSYCDKQWELLNIFSNIEYLLFRSSRTPFLTHSDIRRIATSSLEDFKSLFHINYVIPPVNDVTLGWYENLRAKSKEAFNTITSRYFHELYNNDQINYTDSFALAVSDPEKFSFLFNSNLKNFITHFNFNVDFLAELYDQSKEKLDILHRIFERQRMIFLGNVDVTFLMKADIEALEKLFNNSNKTHPLLRSVYSTDDAFEEDAKLLTIHNFHLWEAIKSSQYVQSIAFVGGLRLSQLNMAMRKLCTSPKQYFNRLQDLSIEEIYRALGISYKERDIEYLMKHMEVNRETAHWYYQRSPQIATLEPLHLRWVRQHSGGYLHCTMFSKEQLDILACTEYPNIPYQFSKVVMPYPSDRDFPASVLKWHHANPEALQILCRYWVAPNNIANVGVNRFVRFSRILSIGCSIKLLNPDHCFDMIFKSIMRPETFVLVYCCGATDKEIARLYSTPAQSGFNFFIKKKMIQVVDVLYYRGEIRPNYGLTFSAACELFFNDIEKLHLIYNCPAYALVCSGLMAEEQFGECSQQLLALLNNCDSQKHSNYLRILLVKGYISFEDILHVSKEPQGMTILEMISDDQILGCIADGHTSLLGLMKDHLYPLLRGVNLDIRIPFPDSTNGRVLIFIEIQSKIRVITKHNFFEVVGEFKKKSSLLALLNHYIDDVTFFESSEYGPLILISEDFGKSRKIMDFLFHSQLIDATYRKNIETRIAHVENELSLRSIESPNSSTLASQ